MRNRYNDIQAHQAEVVVVSFGTEFWVRVWLEQTQAPFPLLLDPERAGYKAYGLQRSMARAWGLRSSWYYFKAVVLRRQRLHSSHGEDTGQMGGDFIIDRHGILRFTHPSQDPTDRPPVEQLLAELARLQDGATHF
ncbi:MAG: hypothetical protein D6768_20350 [Chloroflexi bacterium]|nr:MAG: hypothetical protein D6768_20350 [Chloroflexota bacterium]